MYKKILIGFVLTGLLAQSLILPNLARAEQAPWYAPTYQDFNQKVTSAPEGEIFGERYTHAQVWWIIYSVIRFAIENNVAECIGENPEFNSALECMGINPNSTTGADASSSSLGFLEFGRMADLMIRMRPASGIQYTASILDRIGIETAYAQESGFGFNTLSPVLGLWRASRNASYALVTLAVVVLAFMVMFRMRISPQVTIGVMTAIPRVIIGLLLITFSFAIAGFVIDMAYVVQGVIAAVVVASGITTSEVVPMFNLINDIGGGLISFGLMVVVSVLMGSTTSVGGITIPLVTPVTVISTIVVAIIVLIILLIALVRIFWIFLRTYVMTIFHVVALPFAALTYVTSTGNNMFMMLMRSLIGNVSVFVSVSLVVMAAHVLVWTMGGGGAPNLPFLNPYGIQPQTAVNTGGLVSTAYAQDALVRLPGFSGVDVNTLALFIGVITLLMAPSIANNIKSLIISGQMSRERTGMIGAGAAAAAFAGARTRGLTEAGILGHRMTGSANPVIRFVGEQMRGAAIRQGALQVPSPTRVRRPGEV